MDHFNLLYVIRERLVTFQLHVAFVLGVSGVNLMGNVFFWGGTTLLVVQNFKV